MDRSFVNCKGQKNNYKTISRLVSLFQPFIRIPSGILTPDADKNMNYMFLNPARIEAGYLFPKIKSQESIDIGHIDRLGIFIRIKKKQTTNIVTGVQVNIHFALILFYK